MFGISKAGLKSAKTGLLYVFPVCAAALLGWGTEAVREARIEVVASAIGKCLATDPDSPPSIHFRDGVVSALVWRHERDDAKGNLIKFCEVDYVYDRQVPAASRISNATKRIFSNGEYTVERETLSPLHCTDLVG